MITSHLKKSRAISRFVALALIVGSALLISGCATQPPPSDHSFALGAWSNGPVTNTVYGSLKGGSDKEAWAWRGVPYAQAPVGALRWKAPIDPKPWMGERDATSFGPYAPQSMPIIGGLGSEDCLYLNVWRPKSADVGLPVYVYIHGGGNTIGSSTLGDYSGAVVAAKSNVVFVSMNYRLGVLGWFRAPGVTSGSGGTAEDESGNFGTLDIIKALQWIKLNIAAFGGDPSCVTITGESAGAMNVLSLLTSPVATGLFHRALSESGVSQMRSVDQAETASASLIRALLIHDGRAKDEASAAKLASSMGAEELAAYLRSKSPGDLMARIPESPMGAGMSDWPTIYADGFVLPAKGYEVFADGSWANRVPVILGCNKDEMKLFQFLANKPPKGSRMYALLAKYRSLLWRTSGVDSVATAMLAAPLPPGATAKPPVYAYRFDWGSIGPDGTSVLPGKMGEELGAFHSSEVPLFLGTWENSVFILTGSNYTEENKPGRIALSSLIMRYLANFARTGNPAGDGLRAWPAWDASAGGFKLIVFDAGFKELKLSSITEAISPASIRQLIETELAEPEKSAVLKELKGEGSLNLAE